MGPAALLAEHIPRACWLRISADQGAKAAASPQGGRPRSTWSRGRTARVGQRPGQPGGGSTTPRLPSGLRGCLAEPGDRPHARPRTSAIPLTVQPPLLGLTHPKFDGRSARAEEHTWTVTAVTAPSSDGCDYARKAVRRGNSHNQRGPKMRWPWDSTEGRPRRTRGWIGAAVLMTVGLLLGTGYAVGLARNSGASIQQRSQAQGNPDPPETSTAGTGTPGAPGAPGNPGAPGSPGRPGTSGKSEVPEGPKGGSTTTSSTTTTTIKPPPQHKWFLPPAGPTAPSGNEDVAYRSLNGGRCASVLDSADSGHFDLERHGWLLVGNAHACLDNLQRAEQAADRAEQFPWPVNQDPETVRQICALDQALRVYLNRPARSCGAQAEPPATDEATAPATETTS
jgi:hypothetical protein